MKKNIRTRRFGYGASNLGKYLSHYSLSKNSFIYNLFKYHLPVIDTSPSYFFGFSEIYINFLIKYFKKRDIKIFTKIGYPHNFFYKLFFFLGIFDRNAYFKDKNLFHKSIETSIARLSYCKIDCLFLHSPVIKEVDLSLLKRELKQLISNKKIGSIGISLCKPNDLKFFLQNKFIPKYIQISVKNYLSHKYFYINICKKYKISIVLNRIFSYHKEKIDKRFLKNLIMDKNIKFILIGITQNKHLYILDDN